MPSFERLHQRRHDASQFLYAFDLDRNERRDLRCEPRHVRNGPQYSFQSPGTAERYGAYPESGTLLVRATGTGTNGRDMHA
jgi:hypothetical protein